MSKNVVIALSAIAAVLIVGAVGYGLTAIARANDPAEPPGFGSSVAASGATQASDGGGVQVQVTFDQAAAGQEAPLSFQVAMNTHSVELGDYDLAKLSRVILDPGPTLEGAVWTPEGAGTGHHVAGTLAVPDPEGLARAAGRVVLEIRGLPGPDVRRFEWQVPGR